MVVPWLVSSIHLLALAIGFASARERANALRGTLDDAGFRRVFRADSWWGTAALLWLATGLWRAFGGIEKGTAYYMTNGLFHAKLGLFVVIIVLEIAPMVALMKWRMQRARGESPDVSGARRFAVITDIESALLVAIVFLATAIARGVGPQ